MDNPTPTVGGWRAPAWSNLLQNLPRVSAQMLAFVFVRAYIDYGTKGYAEDYNYTKPWHGIEIPILIGIGGLLLGRADGLLLVRLPALLPAQVGGGAADRPRGPTGADRRCHGVGPRLGLVLA
jgi:hypothetical protein